MSQVTVIQLAAVVKNELTADNACEKCGWYDWFCTDNALVRRSTKFVNLAKRLDAKWGKVGLFLKNNCPMIGSTYDSFVLQNSNGDNHFWVENRDGWRVIDVPNNCTTIFEGNARGVADFLNAQEVPN